MKNQNSVVLAIILVVVLIAGSVFSIIHIKNNNEIIANLNRDIATLKEEATKKEEENKELISDVAMKISHIEALNMELSNGSDQIAALAAESSDKSEQINTLKADIMQQTNQIDMMKADVAEKTNQIEVLNAGITEKAKEIKDLSMDLANKNEKIGLLSADVEKTKEEVEKLNADSADKASQINALTSEVAASSTQVNNLTNEVTSQNELIEGLKADITQKDKRIETLEASTSNLETQIASLTSALDKAYTQGATTEPKPIEPIIPVLSGDNWEITHEYAFTSASYHFSNIVIHHMKEKDQTISVTFSYFNKNNELIGVKTKEIAVASSNVDYYISAANDSPYDYVTYTVKLKDQDFLISISKQFDIKTSIVGKKVIITATNNSNETLGLTSFDALFLDENGNFVASDLGFFDDVEPGESVIEEAKPSNGKEFTKVVIYIAPALFKW